MTRGDAPARSIFALLERGRERQASDLHVEPEHGAAYRIYARIERIPGCVVEPADVASFVETTVDRVNRARLDRLGIADTVYADDAVGAIRIHATRGRAGIRLAIRLLARAIPDLDELRLPSVVASFADAVSGLIVVAGPTGSGKSTTIASLLDRINATSARHIVTFEDPVEYQHRWLQSIVTQYEVGRDVATFAEGIRGALRADPDVVFVGEMRGLDTVAAALQAAETGHLVFAAVHTPSESAQTINRIVGLFPADEQASARARLADALRAMIGLRLIPSADRSGLHAAVEVAIVNDAVRRIIRDGATHQLRSTIVAGGRRDGSQTLEAHLSELVALGDVDLATARAASPYPDDVREPIGTTTRHR